MGLTTKDYFLRLDSVQNIFQKIIKKFCTNQYLREQTELHTFLIEQTKQNKNIYFDGKLVPDERLKNKNPETNMLLIQEYLRDNFAGREYILEEAEIVQNKEIKYRVFLILLSTCLDKHYGDFVLKCVSQQLQEVCNQFLKTSSQEINRIVKYDIDELSQDAFDNIEIRIAFMLQTMFKPLNIDLVNSLSGEYYEKAECFSNMVFLPREAVKKLKKNDLLIYHFENIDFKSENNRLLRKLLQVTQQDLALVLGETNERKSFNVPGICEKEDLNDFLKNNDGTIIPCIRVEIKGHMHWNMFLNEKYILSCKNGHYKIECSLEDVYLKEKIAAYFGTQQDDYDDLIDSIIQSQNQGHGTMLIIMNTEDAVNEAERIGSLCYGFREKEPRRQAKINCLNAIDGSVIIDTKGKVHGIGMILDGISLENGNPARGARYNSAVKYCSYLRNNKDENGNDNPIKAMILIVSEDGFADIISV